MTTNIIPGLRTDRKDSEGFVPVYVFIYQGERLVSRVSIGQKVNPLLWNKSERRVDKKHKNATLINSLINKTVADLETKILEEKIVKGSVDLQGLLKKEKFKEVDFFEFAQKQIKEKNYAPETRRNYGVYLDKIKTFRSSLRLSEVNYQFLQGYEAYLRNELKNEANTVWGNMKFISTVINDAFKMKYINENPFTVYNRPKYKQTRREFLDNKELASIDDFRRTTEDESLKQVSTFFLFMAYTGLRFSDAIRFRKDSHVINDERIVIETQKTKQVANVYINDKIRSVIDYVDANPVRITQVDFNRKLKVIAAGCKIKKKVSSHVARHSFGASLVAAGVSEKVAQGLLAHGSAQSTKIYFHLNAPSLDEAMKKL